MKNEVGFPFLDEILPSIKKTFNADQVAIEKKHKYKPGKGKSDQVIIRILFSFPLGKKM